MTLPSVPKEYGSGWSPGPNWEQYNGVLLLQIEAQFLGCEAHNLNYFADWAAPQFAVIEREEPYFYQQQDTVLTLR